MGAPGWLTREAAQVPDHDCWLSPHERTVLAHLSVPPRRADWRLGRFTAKTAVGAWLDMAPARVQIIAAADGAPEAWIGRERAPVEISISHRAGRALAAVADAGALGCDLELVEPRSDDFVREWLGPAECDAVASIPPAERPRLVNLLWSAKEAAAKVRRAGLRLDMRDAYVSMRDVAGDWRPLEVEWSDASCATHGWWRLDGRWVITIAARPAPDPPLRLIG